MASAESSSEEKSATISTELSEENNDNNVIRRRYGVRTTHADEDTLPAFARTSFFQKGREFESAYVNHKFTDEEKHQLATYDSLDYFPPHSVVYKVQRMKFSKIIGNLWTEITLEAHLVQYISYFRVNN